MLAKRSTTASSSEKFCNVRNYTFTLPSHSFSAYNCFQILLQKLAVSQMRFWCFLPIWKYQTLLLKILPIKLRNYVEIIHAYVWVFPRTVLEIDSIGTLNNQTNMTNELPNHRVSNRENHKTTSSKQIVHKKKYYKLSKRFLIRRSTKIIFAFDPLTTQKQLTHQINRILRANVNSSARAFSRNVTQVNARQKPFCATIKSTSQKCSQCDLSTSQGR